jgi:hypothetical protein
MSAKEAMHWGRRWGVDLDGYGASTGFGEWAPILNESPVSDPDARVLWPAHDPIAPGPYTGP